MQRLADHAAIALHNTRLCAAGERVHGLLRDDDGVGFAVEPVMDWTELRDLDVLGIQERLEALGGTLQIISAPGQGTTLQITLPAATPDPFANGSCRGTSEI